MLKFDINKFQMRQAVVCGALDDIIAECVGLITFLYGTLCEQSEDAGWLFKESLVHLIQDEENIIFDASMVKHMRGDAHIKGGGVYSGDEKIDEEELTEMLDTIGLMHLDNDEKAEIMRMLCGIGRDEDSEDSSIGKIVNSSFDYPNMGEDGADNEDQ